MVNNPISILTRSDTMESIKKTINIKIIQVVAESCNSYDDCISECIELSIKFKCDVQFEIRDQVYYVRYFKIINSIERPGDKKEKRK